VPASFQVWPWRVGEGVLRELRRQNSEEQHDQDGTQSDPMFLPAGFSFRGPQTRRTFSIRTGQSPAPLAYCLINAAYRELASCLENIHSARSEQRNDHERNQRLGHHAELCQS
jgi:hypothetical protein